MHTLFSFKGAFQCWLYTVSHGQLLLRRNKSNEILTRVDVLFKNVAMIQLPTVFDGLSVAEASIGTVSGVREQFGSLDAIDKKLYLLQGTNYEGYIVAGSVTWIEDNGEYHEPSNLML